MEHISLENVREAGTDRVYNVTVADEGVHLMHVTNTAGLNDYAGGVIQFHTYRSRGDDQMDALFSGEEEVSEQTSPDITDREYSRSYAWGEIEEARLSSDDPPTLRLHAGSDRMTLTFPNTPPERVRDFAGKLTAQVELEKAGQREMRR